MGRFVTALSKIAYLNRLAANIINQEDLQDYLTRIYENAVEGEVSDPSIEASLRKWIYSNLRNYFINEYEDAWILQEPEKYEKNLDEQPEWLQKIIKEGKDFYRFYLDEEEEEYFRIVLRYLATLKLKDYSRVSAKDAYRKAGEWYRTEQKRAKEQRKQDGERPVYHTDNLTFKQLTTTEALENEGILMKNCLVSNEHGMWAKLEEGDSEFYSGRLKNNHPVVTIEFSPYDKNIEQIKGHNNGKVPEEYHEDVVDFLKHLRPKEILSDADKIGDKFKANYLAEFDLMEYLESGDFFKDGLDYWDDETDEYRQPRNLEEFKVCLEEYIDNNNWEDGSRCDTKRGLPVEMPQDTDLRKIFENLASNAANASVEGFLFGHDDETQGKLVGKNKWKKSIEQYTGDNKDILLRIKDEFDTLYPGFDSFKDAVKTCLKKYGWDNKKDMRSDAPDSFKFPMPDDSQIKEWYEKYSEEINKTARKLHKFINKLTF